MEITIVCVGEREGDLSLDAAQALRGGGRILLHTEKCGCARWLAQNGIAFSSLDDIYEKAEDFDAHARMAADAVLACAEMSVLYGVMNLADESVKYLMESGARVRVRGGGNEGELLARARGATLVLGAMDLEDAAISADQNTLVREIDTRALAGDVKLALMEHYPEESTMYVKTPGGSIARCKLVHLDRLAAYDHTCACLAPAQRELTKLERFDFRGLMRLVAALRDPVSGCPWDRAQTHESLKRDAIEEAYEVQDAIENGDTDALSEELGDLIFASALQISIAQSHGEFTEGDVFTGIARKMISRHSHVFGNDRAETEDALTGLWARAKMREKGLKTPIDEMNAVAKGLPALMRAQKVIKKAQRAQKSGALRGELPVCARGETDAQALGDALLKTCLKAVQSDLDAEKALEDAVSRFIDRCAQTMGESGLPPM